MEFGGAADAPSLHRRSIVDPDVLAPGRRLPPEAGAHGPVAPEQRVERFHVRVAVAVHVREIEAEAWPRALLLERGEARPEVSAAPALDRDLLWQVARRVLGGVLQRRIDLEDDDALGLKLGCDFANLGPERRESIGVDRTEFEGLRVEWPLRHAGSFFRSPACGWKPTARNKSSCKDK